MNKRASVPGLPLALLVYLALLQVDLVGSKAVMINCEPRFASVPTISGSVDDQHADKTSAERTSNLASIATDQSSNNELAARLLRRSPEAGGTSLSRHNESSTSATSKSGERPPDGRTRNGTESGGSGSPTSAMGAKGFQDLDSEREIQQQKLKDLQHKYMDERALDDQTFSILLLIYSIFIIFGTISNSLICLTVILRPRILSPRNIFIVNLAGSDLLLCVFTMPLSFIEISFKLWQLGLIPCKLGAGLQATSVFVSTISITAIALDRYRVIVYPMHQEVNNGTRSTALLLVMIWLGALLLSAPLFTFRSIRLVHFPLIFQEKGSIRTVEFCLEEWPVRYGRGIYSAVSMIVQYVLPITIVSVVYAKISDQLRKRLIRRQRITQLECQQKRQLNLIKRTHTMLISVSLVFGLSWLPLNLLNLVGDLTDVFNGSHDNTFRIIFAVCNLFGCSSACTNPILYGFMNENFRKEFLQVYRHYVDKLKCLLVCCWCCEDVCLPEGGNEITNADLQKQPQSQNQHQQRSGQTATIGKACGIEGVRRFSAALGGLTGVVGARASGVKVCAKDALAKKRPRRADDERREASLSSGSLAAPCSTTSCDRNSSYLGGSCSSLESPRLPAAQAKVPKSTRADYLLAANSIDSQSASRRLSFQTIASGRATLGKTMRLCLCVTDGQVSASASSLSSVNTQDGSNRLALVKLEQPGEATDTCAALTCSSDKAKSDRKPVSGLSGCSRPDRKRRQKARQAWQQQQSACECSCHRYLKSADAPEPSRQSPASAPVTQEAPPNTEDKLADTRGLGLTKGATPGKVVNNGSLVNKGPNSLRARLRAQSSATMTTMTSSTIDIKRARASGTRVWLRFFAPAARGALESLAAQECRVASHRTRTDSTKVAGGRSSQRNDVGRCQACKHGRPSKTERRLGRLDNDDDDKDDRQDAALKSNKIEGLPLNPDSCLEGRQVLGCYLGVETNRWKRNSELSDQRSTSVIVLNLAESPASTAAEGQSGDSVITAPARQAGEEIAPSRQSLDSANGADGRPRVADYELGNSDGGDHGRPVKKEPAGNWPATRPKSSHEHVPLANQVRIEIPPEGAPSNLDVALATSSSSSSSYLCLNSSASASCTCSSASGSSMLLCTSSHDLEEPRKSSNTGDQVAPDQLPRLADQPDRNEAAKLASSNQASESCTISSSTSCSAVISLSTATTSATGERDSAGDTSRRSSASLEIARLMLAGKRQSSIEESAPACRNLR